jgi:type I restriction enzyme S subunit
MNFESLSDLTTYLQRGISPKYAESGIPVVNQKCIRNGQLKNEDIKFHGNEKTYAQEKELRKDDILVNSTGVGTLGRVARFSNEIGKMLADSHVTIVRADVEKIDPLYLFYVLRFNEPTIVELGAGSTGQTELSRLALGSLQIPIPNRSVQRFVADTLSNIDKKILTNQRLAKVLEEIAQAIFKSWFIDFDPVKAKMAGEKPAGMDAATAALFPDSMEDSELGLMPQGWQARQLKSALVLHKSTIKAGTETESVPYVPIDQIGSRDIFLKNSMSGSEAKTSLVSFEKNEILFGAMRPYFHKVVLAPFDGTTRTTTFVLRAINPRYLAFSLLTVFQDSAVAYATNHSQGTTIPYAVWNNSFENYPLVFPSETVATAFNDLVLPLIEYGYSLVTENQKLVQLRDGLLPRLISGELQIPEEMLAS